MVACPMRSDPHLDPLSDPPSLEGLDQEARVEAMVAWFYENFEDPANEMPYDGKEGGYQYIHGGPYEAADYIPDAFPDADEEDHIAAIDAIDAEGPDYAPAGHRVRYPEEPEPHEEPPSLPDRLNALGGQLDRIEEVVDRLLAVQWEKPAGIGHNHPPEDADGPPAYNDLLDVKQSVDEVRQELVKPDAANNADVAVLDRAQSRIAWLKQKLLWIGKAFLSGSIAGVGGWATKQVLDDPAGAIQLAGHVVSTLGHWIVNIQPLF